MAANWLAQRYGTRAAWSLKKHFLFEFTDALIDKHKDTVLYRQRLQSPTNLNPERFLEGVTMEYLLIQSCLFQVKVNKIYILDIYKNHIVTPKRCQIITKLIRIQFGGTMDLFFF